MLGKMGSQQSSVNCGNLNYRLNNCFGMGNASPGSDGSKRSSVILLANADTSPDKDVTNMQPTQVCQGKRQSHRLSCADACCTKNTAEVRSLNNFCDVSQNVDNEENNRLVSPGKTAMNGICKGQTFTSCTCTKNKLNCPCLKYQEQYNPVASSPIECLPTSESTKHANNNVPHMNPDLKQLEATTKLVNVKSGDADNTISTNQDNLLSSKSSTLCSEDSSETQDTPYFRKLVETEESNLKSLIRTWSKLLSSENHCPSEVCDEIRSVVGQTSLIIDERFSQFCKLIDQADNKSVSTRPVLVSDLQGFWDMIYFQVEDVVQKFKVLQKLKENNWIANNPDTLVSGACRSNCKDINKNTKNRQRKIRPQTKSKEEDKKRREAARKRLAEVRKTMARRSQVNSPADQPAITTSNEMSTLQQLAQEQSANTTDLSISEPLAHSSTFDAVSCSMAAVPNSQEVTVASVASTSSSLVH